MRELPAYTKATKNTAFLSIVEDLEAFHERNPDGVVTQAFVEELYDIKLVEGFGAALLIVSSIQLDSDARKRFDAVCQSNMDCENAIEARLLKIDVSQVDIPNISRTGGGILALPAWDDAKKRQELTTILLRQIELNLVGIKASQDFPSVKATISQAHDAFMSRYLIGILRGIDYSKTDYFANMVYLDSDGGKHDPIKRLNELEAMLGKMSAWKLLKAKKEKPQAQVRTIRGGGVECLAARYFHSIFR